MDAVRHESTRTALQAHGLEVFVPWRDAYVVTRCGHDAKVVRHRFSERVISAATSPAARGFADHQPLSFIVFRVAAAAAARDDLSIIHFHPVFTMLRGRMLPVSGDWISPCHIETAAALLRGGGGGSGGGSVVKPACYNVANTCDDE